MPPAISDHEDNSDHELAVSAEDSDGDEELANDEYVVEKIISHMVNAKGKLLFQVKWEGYEKKSDRTWETEENLTENASLIVEEYIQSAGGRGKVSKGTANPKGKKRRRQSTRTPPATRKRSKKKGEDLADEDTPLTPEKGQWTPPTGSWENHIALLEAYEDEDTRKLIIEVTWKNGHKTEHDTSVIYSRCPQKMLQYYERQIRIIKSVPAE
ncbi:hypothetical protein B0T26DRAFT_756795 [Lasiosphaeria miniovina]|uniref:Chromo domain-containing protein n=1 Tax=Lasiosphaeria miniovina TaxID=1954250 RepID=A0AA39ZTF5_9PEZI|nr:uncharacterized protein B0T26DRAFT_756795 [Lasiosphaeria miniovina]KAK0703230.1 hypothetical protein B0T26DRAFT_756795 [Lasiosphaeria miniovina]